MDNTQYAGFVAKVVLLFLAVAGTHQSLWAQSELHFRLVNNTLVVISMRSNQAGTFTRSGDTFSYTYAGGQQTAPVTITFSQVPLP